MAIMDGDDMQRLWSLIEDLTNQLQANRQLCESLQQQADQLRGQAIHSGTGFALRRFNTDISKEKFESELESLNVHLVKENLALSHENKQQAVLLREYENTLETVMAKFRSFSHSTQQHTLQLTQHYESLLAQNTHNAAQQTLAAETAFSGTLTHLGGLVRRAMQSLDGEFSDDDDDDAGAVGDAQPRKSNRGWIQDPKWYGSGGYTGKDPAALRADDALEHLTEEERLRMENETFRELLGLKEKSDALLSTLPNAEAGAVVHASKSLSPAERRASLTVDEAAIAAEASGQPSSNALQVSSTLRPDDKPSSPGATIPSATRSPKLAPTLERKEQIIEEAILADEEQDTERGRRAADASPVISADSTAFERVTAAAPAGTAADEAESAPSSIQELRAAASQSQAVAEPPVQSETVKAGEDADAITPIDEVDTIQAAEPATSEGPNLVAEAAPPALVSTGMEDADALSSKTTVTSVSGSQAADAVVDSTTSSSSSVSPKSEPSSLTTPSDTSSTEASSPVVSDDAALPNQESEALDEATSSVSAAQPTDEASEAEPPVASIPAEPSKEDEQSAQKEAAAEVTAGAHTVASDASSGSDADEANPDTKAEAIEADKDAAAAKHVQTPKEQPGQGKKADGSASPSKKGGRHRGKGRHHHKSHSSASSKGSS